MKLFKVAVFYTRSRDRAKLRMVFRYRSRWRFTINVALCLLHPLFKHSRRYNGIHINFKILTHKTNKTKLLCLRREIVHTYI